MQPTKKATVQLLDRGQFIITRLDETMIKGRFTMVVFERFCEPRDLNYFQLLHRITIGMKIGDYADLLLFSFQDYFRKMPDQCPVTRQDVLDIIDEMGGISKDFLSIILHAVDRISAGEEASVSEEVKKKLQTSLHQGKQKKKKIKA